ncbi:hypothetical protein [Methylobacterium aquaticum]|uniref:hypothetical protein n=1 Tax=Methylobacterium aquaticum TaxID=270351 RepID=UPI001932DDA1|nr:hypothetical protein [Methylobacterium aquaticum]QRE76484.1 hypothetical protein F1D61_25545 [Methylobacterium aquaticum]
MPPIKITDDNARFINTTARFDDDGTAVMDGEIAFNMAGVEMIIPFNGAKSKKDALKVAAGELERRAKILINLSGHYIPKIDAS